jgi:ribonuclease Z
MLTNVRAGSLSVRGVSVGGIYTSLFVPELSALFDVGIPARSFAAADHLFLSHGHVDHVGALSSFLGIRALVGKQKPPRVYMPAAIVEPLQRALRDLALLQRYELAIDPVPMEPGDRVPMTGDLQVQCVRTYHGVPSLGYSLVRNIKKLRPEFAHLPGAEIGERRRRGDDIFDEIERRELSYCTDTLVQVLDNNPELYHSRVLILECTFLDERKSLEASRAGCHIHLDEILERAELFGNEHLVLMHLSQLYKPNEVVGILDRRCPEDLRRRIVPFVPSRNRWPG